MTRKLANSPSIDDVVLGDWGTTRLRLYRLVGDTLVARTEGAGIGLLDRPANEELAATLAPWRATGPVFLCGMAGAHGGLTEVAYASCPIGLAEWAKRAASIARDGGTTTIAAGLRCRRADGTPDVMRGEETQIFGALALRPALSTGRQRIVLPGTHSKWATVEEGIITSFQTYPTGELFDLLANRSTLVARGRPGRGDETLGFADGLGHAGPDLLRRLFAARAMQLSDGRSEEWARGFLSGLLIGSETGAQVGDDRVIVIGEGTLAARYQQALLLRGVGAETLSGEEAVIAGLRLLGQGRKG